MTAHREAETSLEGGSLVVLQVDRTGECHERVVEPAAAFLAADGVLRVPEHLVHRPQLGAQGVDRGGARGDGLDGLDVLLNGEVDLAIVDLMLPRLDGLGVIERMHERGVRVPVLILSAKRSLDERVRGLRAGGDDYLVKPFAFSELLARVDALLRRAGASADPEPGRLEFHDLSLDLLARRVHRAGRAIALQPREFALLEYLARHAGQVVSRTMIPERVWHYGFDPCTSVVEARISKLREKIDRDFGVRLIHTVRGAGYVPSAPDG